MGILPASTFGVSEIEAPRFFSRYGSLNKTLFAVLGLALWVLFLVPPLSTWSSQYEFVQATQFCSFAMVAPLLVVAGQPWKWLGLASGQPLSFSSDGVLVAPLRLRYLERVSLRRTSRPGHQRAIVLLMVFMAQSVLWRLSSVVNFLGHHSWLSIVESLTLMSAGVLLWFELIDSTPLRPSTTRPYRIGVSAVAMWTIWVIAYLMAMSRNSWYPSVHLGAHRLLSRSADQQLTAAMMWFLTAVVFLPLIFSNLSRWLQSEEDPSDELLQLVRKEETRGFFGPRA